MKLSLIMILAAMVSLPACALDGSVPTGTQDSELDDPMCGALYSTYQACDAREARYDANGKRIEQFVCVEESNAWADCKNPRRAADTDASSMEAIAVDPMAPDAAADDSHPLAEKIESGAPPFITVPQ